MLVSEVLLWNMVWLCCVELFEFLLMVILGLLRKVCAGGKLSEGEDGDSNCC